MDQGYWGFVLFIDEDPVARQFADVVLRSAGLRCRAVGSAESALVAASVMRFDVVVLDWDLPGAIGADELARRLVAVRDPPPVLVQTPHPSAHVPRGSPIAGFLRKPYSAEELIDVIFGVLPRRPPGTEGQRP
jgi:DNA-binding response OmpR family regulator